VETRKKYDPAGYNIYPNSKQLPERRK